MNSALVSLQTLKRIQIRVTFRHLAQGTRVHCQPWGLNPGTSHSGSPNSLTTTTLPDLDISLSLLLSPSLSLLLSVVKYERIKFLVLALKNAVEVYAWAPKPYHKFMAFKVRALPRYRGIKRSQPQNERVSGTLGRLLMSQNITFRAFERCFYPKRKVNTHVETQTAGVNRHSKVTASSSGAIRVKCLAQGSHRHSSPTTS